MVATDTLRGILELVEESLDAPAMSAADLAGRAYLSRFHFDRLVSAAVGEPPGAFRRRLLLERAAHRLTTTELPVIEVALDAGYRAPEAFARAFSRAFGVSPSAYRRRYPTAVSAARHELPCPNGIHFHPPGGLRLPPDRRSDAMDVLLGMLDHHLELSGDIIDRLDGIADEVLDAPITLSVEGIDDDPTLRRLADKLVYQLEMWNAAVAGATSMPPEGDTSPAGLRTRLDAAAPRFRELVVKPIEEGRARETFVDAVCDPPETFTFGGMVAHVLTFSAVRRTLAIGALDSAGVTDLGSGDPMHFIGGTGNDASDITRRRD